MALVLLALLAAGANAQVPPPPAPVAPLAELRWSAGRSAFAGAVAEDLDPPAGQMEVLGELLFSSPTLFGGLGRRFGLSCAACHPGGHRNASFFIPGVSDQPGTFDPTNPLFNLATDDGRFAPIEIPTLRGVAAKSAFGARGEPSLKRFIRAVIVEEFAGAEPPELALDALVAYVTALPPKPPRHARPARLADDLAAVARQTAVMEAPLAREDASLALTTLAALRAGIGRVHERFAGPGLEDERALLEGWGEALGQIERGVEGGAWPRARTAHAAWRKDFLRRSENLVAAEARSLYSPDRLADFLNRGGR
ncbi:MAG: hypothetical protein FJX47_08330 [Alphaproteobacteria bacterium]|nr:hypothetical protein [Alphaproteobacteria bacterium]